MTTQIESIYRYNDVLYSCLDVSNTGGLFNPKDYGLKPTEIITACARGFWCEYEIINGHLVLQQLHIHDKDNYYPPINGVSITPKECIPGISGKRYVDGQAVFTEIPRYYGHETYENLALAIPFTGKLLLAADYYEEYWTFKGYEWPYGYRKLLSLEFENGNLRETHDHSELAQMVRKKLISDNKPKYYWGTEYIDALPNRVRKTVWWYPPPEERERRKQEIEQDLFEFLNDVDAKQQT